MKLHPSLSILLLAALSTVAAAQEKAFHLQDGDRVVFYGDSITDQRLYTTFTETYVVTRFPALDVTFTHSGWGGDRVGGGGGGNVDLRLERDVFAYKPTVMTIMLGMNDGSYRAFDQQIFDRYRTGYEHIVASLMKHAPGLRLTLIQPSPFDDVNQPPAFEGGYNQVLVRYGEFLKELADREYFVLADLNRPVVAALEKAKATDADLAKKIIPDRVHPGAAGHLLMAAELLKAWNAPSLVCAIEIEAATPKVVRTVRSTVSNLAQSDRLSWTQRDQALPLPIDTSDAVMALAVRSSDIESALNQQPLTVTGLKSGTYQLSIDGVKAGEFSAEQLAAGINLAMLPTPMVNQAKEVHRLTLQHNNVHFTRWRQVQVPLAGYGSSRVKDATRQLIAALDEEEAEIVKNQRAAAQPVEHRFELVPQ